MSLSALIQCVKSLKTHVLAPSGQPLNIRSKGLSDDPTVAVGGVRDCQSPLHQSQHQNIPAAALSLTQAPPPPGTPPPGDPISVAELPKSVIVQPGHKPSTLLFHFHLSTNQHRKDLQFVFQPKQNQFEILSAYRATMCSADFFLAFLAILFPPLPGKSIALTNSHRRASLTRQFSMGQVRSLQC